jgi:hypothetical protein
MKAAAETVRDAVSRESRVHCHAGCVADSTLRLSLLPTLVTQPKSATFQLFLQSAGPSAAEIKAPYFFFAFFISSLPFSFLPSFVTL